MNILADPQVQARLAVLKEEHGITPARLLLSKRHAAALSQLQDDGQGIGHMLPIFGRVWIPPTTAFELAGRGFVLLVEGNILITRPGELALKLHKALQEDTNDE